MKIILDCKKTLTVLQQLKAVAPKFTSSLPVIEYIKVVATDDGIFFTATNLDEFVTTMINGQCGEPGTCLIQPAKLLKLLSGKKGTFSVCGQDSDTVISIGSLNIQREKEDPLFTVDDFPEIPVVEYEDLSDNIEATELFYALSRCKYAVKKNSSTFNLDTICIKDGDCIATDGYRLERCPLLLQKPVMLSSGVVKFLTQKGIMSGNVNIKYSEKWLNLSNPITNILTRFPEESYPDYTAVIPENNPLITVIVDRNKTLEVIKSFASLVDTRNPAIRVSINGAMELSCGNTRATIPVIYDKEAEVSFLINRSYLEDALKVSKTADCRLNYYQEGKPIIITSTDQFSLIMPRRE